MAAIRGHFAEHRSHMFVCALAAVLIIIGVAVGVGELAIIGVAACGAMMIGMVWMMVSMASKHGR